MNSELERFPPLPSACWSHWSWQDASVCQCHFPLLEVQQPQPVWLGGGQAASHSLGISPHIVQYPLSDQLRKGRTDGEGWADGEGQTEAERSQIHRFLPQVPVRAQSTPDHQAPGLHVVLPHQESTPDHQDLRTLSGPPTWRVWTRLPPGPQNSTWLRDPSSAQGPQLAGHHLPPPRCLSRKMAWKQRSQAWNQHCTMCISIPKFPIPSSHVALNLSHALLLLPCSLLTVSRQQTRALRQTRLLLTSKEIVSSIAPVVY